MDNLQFYPDDIISNPLKPYVYFEGLSHDIWDKVIGTFSKDITKFKGKNIDLSAIEEAFNFLDAVIVAERSKEEAFLQYLTDKTKNILDLPIPSLDSNWNEFVKLIQTTLDFKGLGIRDLQNEAQRLQKNAENYKEANNQDTRYINDTITRTSQSLTALMNSFQNAKRAHNTNGSKIISVIINEFKDDLLEVRNDKLVFNETELSSLIIMISNIMMQYYNSLNYNLNKTENTPRKTLQEEDLINILENKDNFIIEDIKKLINRIKTYPLLKQQLIEGYGFSSKKPRSQRLSRQIIQNGNLISDVEQIKDEVWNMLHNYTFPRDAIKIITTGNVLAEVTSMTKFAISDAVAVKNTGSAGAKPDNIIGYIGIDLDAIDPIKGRGNEIIEKITKIQNRINLLSNTLNQKNTTEYYQQQAKEWQKACEDIQTLLKQLEPIYKFLPSCFLIEDSTKNYLSLYSRNEGTAQSNGVHGGSLGANITDQLNKIEALTQAGGITMIDKAWLTAAIINSGSNMIAAGQKTSLENYLAMFAAILLFDSQINIAAQAIKSIEENKSKTTVHQIHLFSVNNGYYPLSYVLHLTRQSLSKKFGILQSEAQSDKIISNGVEVEIYGYVSKPNEYSIDAWDTTAALAKKSTKIKMRFLVQFMNIVQNLLSLQ